MENRAAVKAKLQRAQKSRENVDKGQKKFKGDKPLKSLAADPLANEPVPEFSGAKADPKVKGLPSHSGPKIRHRKRPSAENPDGQGGHPSKKPKISRKMLRNPAHRNKSSMKKKSLKVGIIDAYFVKGYVYTFFFMLGPRQKCCEKEIAAQESGE